ncbi:39S ribosomal protein L53, mitochondrial [Halotydeus destructor]|nr:39S ribosomal protein L53, mitochondrial [Halotydeus destructor]
MAGKMKPPYFLLPNQPFKLLPQPKKDPYKKALYTSIKTFNLKHVNRVEFSFDPFHPNVASIREIVFQVSNPKLRNTNLKCSFKTTIATDRSEPQVKVKLENGKTLLYKTSLLSSLEIIDHWKKTTGTYDTAPEEGLA